LINYPHAYVDYLIYFHGYRDFFECHEVLEAYWKEHPNDPKSAAYVGLIQVAVGLYHERRGNKAGAGKMFTSAISNLNLNIQHAEALGLNVGRLTEDIDERIRKLAADSPFVDYNLPISDPALLAYCIQLCEQKNVLWGRPSDLNNVQILHKHTLRDRSDVIREREKQAKLRLEARKPASSTENGG
jgi:uncharacterized protein